MGRFRDWLNKVTGNSQIHETSGGFYGIGRSTPVLQGLNGKDIYLSDFVNNCIDRTASEISKIRIKSVVTQSGTVVANDDITRLFRYKPNPYQTTSDFLSAIEWTRKKHMNCWIYPEYEWRVTASGNYIKWFKAFHVLNPQSVEVGIGDSIIEIRMHFQDGMTFTFPESELINVKWRRGTNMVLGGNDYGGEDAQNLAPVVDALHKTIDGLPKSIEASLQINGMYTVKTVKDAAKLADERESFEDHIHKSKMGIVATDLIGDFEPIKMDYASVDKETLEFLKGTICERYGVSLEILSGSYDTDDYSSFYQTAIEDFINQFEQAFTDYCFTQREKDVGHQVRCYFSLLQRQSPTDAISLSTLATNTGLMYLDEIRTELFGLEPLPDGEGHVRIQSLNFVDASKATQYQLDGTTATSIKTGEGEGDE